MSSRDDKPPGANKNSWPEVKPGLRILVIEDNPEIRYIISTLLEILECKVKSAGTAKEGLALAEIFKPDAVITDIGLPDSSGHDVASKLRQENYAGVLIALSAYSGEKVKKKSFEVGFDYHLSKPTKLKYIAEILAQL